MLRIRRPSRVIERKNGRNSGSQQPDGWPHTKKWLPSTVQMCGVTVRTLPRVLSNCASGEGSTFRSQGDVEPIQLTSTRRKSEIKRQKKRKTKSRDNKLMHKKRSSEQRWKEDKNEEENNEEELNTTLGNILAELEVRNATEKIITLFNRKKRKIKHKKKRPLQY